MTRHHAGLSNSDFGRLPEDGGVMAGLPSGRFNPPSTVLKYSRGVAFRLMSRCWLPADIPSEATVEMHRFCAATKEESAGWKLAWQVGGQGGGWVGWWVGGWVGGWAGG